MLKEICYLTFQAVVKSGFSSSTVDVMSTSAEWRDRALIRSSVLIITVTSLSCNDMAKEHSNKTRPYPRGPATACVVDRATAYCARRAVGTSRTSFPPRAYSPPRR